MDYEFEWDPAKARVNFANHAVQFESATGVFADPLALTIPDDEHSFDEARWVTLGKDLSGRNVLVIHTYEQISDELARIRLISARKPTKTEMQAYEEAR